MKYWRIVIVLLLCLVLVGSISCNPFAKNEPEATKQLTEVVSGNLTVTVSGSGNLEVTNEMELVFGSGGKVDRIFVQEGDKVSKGNVLAKLETTALKLSLTQAQVAQTTTQLSVTQAQLGLETAEYDLEKAQDLYAQPEIHKARAAVSEAQAYLEYAKVQLAQASTLWDITIWTNEVASAQESLRAVEVSLNEMLAAPDTTEVAIKRLQVEVAKQSLELAKQSLDQAQQAVELAQKQLDESTIIAPFDAMIAYIYVKEGDVIPSPTVAPKTIIHIIDPGSMRLEVQVDEIDITGVKVGQKAIIEVDALPTLPLEGKVSFINLLPTEKTGVIVYDVKIEFDVPENVGIRAGMSATADIIINERSNVLLVPDRAIRQDSSGNTTVEVMANGQIQERPVITGVSDGFQTEIIEGLEEGEVVVERQAKPQSSATGLF